VVQLSQATLYGQEDREIKIRLPPQVIQIVPGAHLASNPADVWDTIALVIYRVLFFFFINLGPVCFSSGSTSTLKVYCATIVFCYLIKLLKLYAKLGDI
jgi:hypothetical protein